MAGHGEVVLGGYGELSPPWEQHTRQNLEARSDARESRRFVRCRRSWRSEQFGRGRVATVNFAGDWSLGDGGAERGKRREPAVALLFNGEARQERSPGAAWVSYVGSYVSTREEAARRW